MAFFSIIKHQKVFLSASRTKAEAIPITLATFFYDDLRLNVGSENRLKIAASNMFVDNVKKYLMIWIEKFYTTFFYFCACESTKKRNKSAMRNAILGCICGPAENDKDSETPSTHIASRSVINSSTTTSNLVTSMDLPKSI